MSNAQLHKTFAIKRLNTDFKELTTNPLHYIAAQPLEDNVFVWHANLLGLHGQLKGVTLHLVLTFPHTYPQAPPVVRLCTELPHPSVSLGKENGFYKICLDLLEEGGWASEDLKGKAYYGWSTSYTVQTILLQLHSFLLDDKLLKSKGNNQPLRYYTSQAEMFSCATCPHAPKAHNPVYPRLLRVTHQKRQIIKPDPMTYDVVQVRKREAENRAKNEALSRSGKDTAEGWSYIPIKKKPTPVVVEDPTKAKKKQKKPEPKPEPEPEPEVEEEPKEVGDPVGWNFVARRNRSKKTKNVDEEYEEEEEEIVEEKPKSKNNKSNTKNNNDNNNNNNNTKTNTENITENNTEAIPKRIKKPRTKKLLKQLSAAKETTKETTQPTTTQSTTITQPTTTAAKTTPQPTAQPTTPQAKPEPTQPKKAVRTDLGNLQALPSPVLMYMFAFLEVQDLGRLACVNTAMSQQAEDGYLWQGMFSKLHPYSSLTPATMKDWKYLYSLEVNNVVESLRCWYTKATFEEDVLGIPIVFTVNPVTEDVDYISSTLDILSQKAYSVYGVRRTVYKESFELFLPLYINSDHFARALPQLKKTIFQLCPNYGAREFVPTMAVSVLCKLMNTMVVLISDKGLTASTKALYGYCAFHRLLIAFINLYPDLSSYIDGQIHKFIKSPEGRHKKACPSLGNFIPLLTVTNSYTWEKVASPYLEESLSRNVLWACVKYPSLAKVPRDSNSVTAPDMERLEKTYTGSETSLKMLMFHVQFLKQVAQSGTKSIQEIASEYDKYYGHPPYRLVNAFGDIVKRIGATNKWPSFFGCIGIKTPNPTEMTKKLVQAVQSSLRKGYHTRKTDFSKVHASGSSVILKKGEFFTASKDVKHIQLKSCWTLGSTFLDATCFIFTDKGFKEFIYFGAENVSFDGAVEHHGDEVDGEKGVGQHVIDMQLDKVDKSVTSLYITLSVCRGDLKSVKHPYVTMINLENNQDLCSYVLEKVPAGNYQAIVMCRIFRDTSNKWSIEALGKFGRGGCYEHFATIQSDVIKLNKSIGHN